MEDLDYIREEIDKIDEELVKMFEKRMELVLKVAEYKKGNNIPILNSEREKQIIDKNMKRLKNKNLTNSLEEFLEDTMRISRKYQCKILSTSIESEVIDFQKEIEKGTQNKRKSDCMGAFPGVPGSFSEQAFIEFFGKDIKRCSVNNFEDVFKALYDEKIDYGVLPIENSSTGGIAEVYDLIRKYGFHIIGEKIIKVDHNLLAINGAKIEDIEEVYSHPQGFSQSCEFLKNYPDWKLIPYINTATSAKFVKDSNSKTKAAIASKKAAELYNLNVLKEGINFNNKNFTRFIVVGRDLEINKQCNKISVVFSILHKVGSLYNILEKFAVSGLNLLKIESRPILGKSWEYFFHVDFQGNLEDEVVRNTIISIKENCSYFKLLGNYRGDSSDI